jgi:MFS family permease
MGIYMALVNLGFVAGTFAAGWFFDWGGYQRAFLLASILSLAALPAAFAANGRENMLSADSGKKPQDPE